MIDLQDYYAAVVAAIQAQFPGFKTVEFDREDRDPRTLQVPACLLTITEFEDAADQDPGTEQWPTVARVEAQVILGFREPAVNLAVRKAATSLAVWLRYRRFPDLNDPPKTLPTGAAMVQGVFLDDFSPELDQFQVWRVEWLQHMDLGASVFAEEPGPTPTPFFSWSPLIGTGNEQHYRPGLRGMAP